MALSLSGSLALWLFGWLALWVARSLAVLINTDTARVDRFVADYRAAMAVEGLQITVDISDHEMTLLDLHMEKGTGWAADGRLDLTVHQKPLSAYLYIPAS